MSANLQRQAGHGPSTFVFFCFVSCREETPHCVPVWRRWRTERAAASGSTRPGVRYASRGGRRTSHHQRERVGPPSTTPMMQPWSRQWHTSLFRRPVRVPPRGDRGRLGAQTRTLVCFVVFPHGVSHPVWAHQVAPPITPSAMFPTRTLRLGTPIVVVPRTPAKAKRRVAASRRDPRVCVSTPSAYPLGWWTASWRAV